MTKQSTAGRALCEKPLDEKWWSLLPKRIAKVEAEASADPRRLLAALVEAKRALDVASFGEDTRKLRYKLNRAEDAARRYLADDR